MTTPSKTYFFKMLQHPKLMEKNAGFPQKQSYFLSSGEAEDTT